MIDVLLTPADLANAQHLLPESQVVIFDVLRATSTMVTALHNGARQIQLFDSLDSARTAKNSAQLPPPVLLAGEEKCLKPADFDLGNSPREHTTEKVGNATILLATTNGTRAANRARTAKHLFAASLLNAAATALSLADNIDATHTLLICAGTDGKLALEDTLGAGALLFSLLAHTYRADLPFTDTAWIAYHAFAAVRNHLPPALRLGQGGLNLIEAGLEDDIDLCANIDAIPITAAIDPQTLTVTRS